MMLVNSGIPVDHTTLLQSFSFQNLFCNVVHSTFRFRFDISSSDDDIDDLP